MKNLILKIRNKIMKKISNKCRPEVRVDIYWTPERFRWRDFFNPSVYVFFGEAPEPVEREK
jgi:hypothetical protein